MLNDNNEAIKELRTRSSKILGGGVSEQMFLETFIFPANIAYSDGWWISKMPHSEQVFFSVVKNELTPLDIKINQKLTDHGYDVFQIISFDDHYEIGREHNFKKIEDFLTDNNISVKALKKRKQYEDAMLDRCIEYYTKIGRLTEKARSIRLEDSFLNSYFYTTNIDLFIEKPNSDTLVCIENKFKNEFKHNGMLVFGEDRLQYETLFPIMLDCGIDVYNCILYNHLKKKRNTDQTDIFNYLDNNNGQVYWKKKEFSPGEKHETYTFSAKHTAWNSDEGRTVYCIPLKQYKTIEYDLFNDDEQGNYWGKCSIKGCNGYLVVKKTRDGAKEFFGCTNYKKHK